MAEEIVWLDDALGTLAEAGLMQEQRRRAPPVLLRCLPAAATPWRPGSPPETLEDGAAAATQGPLVPVAAFSGRRTVLELGGDPPLSAQLLAGRLRAVADERPVARLLLAGPPEEALGIAAALAEDLALLPAHCALAEEGRALARQEAARPRRAGPATLAGAETMDDAVAAAIGHLLEVLLHFAPRCLLEEGPAGVHQMRVALRRLRSVLKTCRPAIRSHAVDAFDDGLKGLAKRLGEARDLDVFLLGHGARLRAALPGEKRMAQLLRAAEARRAAAYEALHQVLDGAGFRLLALQGVALVALRQWRPAADEADAGARLSLLAETPAEFGSSMLDKRWHRLCGHASGPDGEGLAQAPAEALHEARLEAKRMRYVAELFGELWEGKRQRRFMRRLARVQERFGVANDTEVARGLVSGLGPGVPAWAVGVAEGFALAESGETRDKALEAWEDLMLAEPFWDDV